MSSHDGTKHCILLQLDAPSIKRAIVTCDAGNGGGLDQPDLTGVRYLKADRRCWVCDWTAVSVRRTPSSSRLTSIEVATSRLDYQWRELMGNRSTTNILISRFEDTRLCRYQTKRRANAQERCVLMDHLYSSHPLLQDHTYGQCDMLYRPIQRVKLYAKVAEISSLTRSQSYALRRILFKLSEWPLASSSIARAVNNRRSATEYSVKC